MTTLGHVKRLGDFLLNSPAATVLAGTAAVCLVVYLIPGLHSVAWIIGLVSVAVMLGVLMLLQQQWSQEQARIDDLNARLAEARGAIGGVTLSAPAEDEPGEDTRRAERIRELFPTTSGLVQQIRLESGFSELDPQLLVPLRTFLDEFSHTSFENQASHFAFMDFYRAGKAFAEWVDAEAREENGLLEVVPGDERPGGWRSFSDAREIGERRIDAFLRTRQSFERIALENSVIS
ncbi:hypothetical protein GCM10022261_28820 [Brevibacterium daeguense]|uniref:Uncharacterized protein n=1 Tax=Brevibacterium daeguense TaxID=909936 RepID=A0ABP8EMW5_9MICO